MLPPTPVSLVGLVDREVDGRVVRIAVLSFGGRLHYVEAGSRLGAAYEVVAVGSNAVDLLALDTNTPRRLVQRYRSNANSSIPTPSPTAAASATFWNGRRECLEVGSRRLESTRELTRIRRASRIAGIAVSASSTF